MNREAMQVLINFIKVTAHREARLAVNQPPTKVSGEEAQEYEQYLLEYADECEMKEGKS